MMEVDNLNAVSVTSGGYDLEIFHEKENIERYKCDICRKVLKNAIQLQESSVPTRRCLTCYTANARYLARIDFIFYSVA